MPIPDWTGPRCEYCGEPNIEYSSILEREKNLRNKMYKDLIQLRCFPGVASAEHYAPEQLWQIAINEIKLQRLKRIREKDAKR